MGLRFYPAARIRPGLFGYLQAWRASNQETIRQANRMPRASREYRSIAPFSTLPEEFARSPAGGGGAAGVFKSTRGHCPSGTSSTRRFWARPSAVALDATNCVLP
jgi:hypothetical protein